MILPSIGHKSEFFQEQNEAPSDRLCLCFVYQAVKEPESSLPGLLFVFFLVIHFWGGTSCGVWANGFQKNWLKQGVFYSEYID